jgi:putative ABC transport system permease protein
MINYFKQAWNLIRQEKLFSSIYILGTGLSITVVMVLSIVFYIKIANIYPETNRDRMLVVKTAQEKTKDGGTYIHHLSSQTVETCFRSLESAEAVTAIIEWYASVQPDGSEDQLPVTVKYIDTEFWKVFPFRFVSGQSFTQADIQSGVRTAVIAESLAKRLFGTTDATGRQISMDFRPYRVCGVVKDASYVTTRTYAHLWVPYTTHTYYNTWAARIQAVGPFEVCMLAPSADDVERVRQEALEHIDRYNQTLEDREFSVLGQPDRQWQTVFRIANRAPDFTKSLLQYLLVFLVLLFVPAVSLSGMTDSRMERRLAEMGVRRAFGAKTRTLMGQIISENFLFTLLGGIIGLVFSYLFILFCRDWIMQLGQGSGSFGSIPEGAEVVFTPSMLLNMPVFAIALGICFLLNLLSALIPAWRYSHREIIDSLNAKQ